MDCLMCDGTEARWCETLGHLLVWECRNCGWVNEDNEEEENDG